MPMGLSRKFSLRRRVTDAAPLVEPAAAPPAPVVPARHPRVALWVLSAFATVAALVAISAVVIGPQNASLMVVIPLALFWGIAVSVGFAIRAALLNVVKSMTRRKQEKPDATEERLARMVRHERNREALYPHPHGLIHAV
jgi:CBS domain containing-hemolysin-like protein